MLPEIVPHTCATHPKRLLVLFRDIKLLSLIRHRTTRYYNSKKKTHISRFFIIFVRFSGSSYISQRFFWNYRIFVLVF